MEKSDRFLGLPVGGAGAGAHRDARSSALERWLAERLLRAMGGPRFGFRLWDGTDIYFSDRERLATLVVGDRGAFWRMLRNPGLNVADDYATGRLRIDGELLDFLRATSEAGMYLQHGSWLQRHVISRPRIMSRNTRRRARENVYHHYDLGNDFYRLWLDEEMAYTCAYFPREDASLEEAQLAKFDLVCRKLRLQPGERVVEAGCGWGSLALYMAREYGVCVRAYNISHEQIRWARERAAEHDLGDRVEFIEDDYRAIEGEYDCFVSVGMMEHVGRAAYPELGRVIDRGLTDRGRGLLHTIGQNLPLPANEWLTTRIFPGAYPPTLREVVETLEPFGFSIVDMQNLRAHYAKTCEHWLARFDAHRDEIERRYGPAFVRAWRLYLSGSIMNFATGSAQLFQVAFTRPAVVEVPLTRDYMTPRVSSRQRG